MLLKQYYQCTHGPEDHRMLADLPPAKKQRLSKKQRGLSHKVRCVGACGTWLANLYVGWESVLNVT